jgi:MoxR-like ATPase
MQALVRTMCSRGHAAETRSRRGSEVGARLRANIQRAVKVRDEVVRDVLVALLAEGHVLIEDYPGVGKTALARALARSVDAEYARVQCTVDLLPADVIGTNVFNQREARFEFHPGPVFANVVLVDEINRTSPKTQSGCSSACRSARDGGQAHARPR